MRYDILTFIGRLQPCHIGHTTVINKALSLADKVVLLLGTNERDGRTLRNPWTFEERKAMISKVYEGNDKLVILPAYDQGNDGLWVKHVQDTVNEVYGKIDLLTNEQAPKLGLIGCNKDHTSYYLELFPNWYSEAVEFVNPLNATDIRAMLFEKTHQKYEMYDTILPHAVANIVFQDDMGMDDPNAAECLRQKYMEGKANAS